MVVCLGDIRGKLRAVFLNQHSLAVGIQVAAGQECGVAVCKFHEQGSVVYRTLAKTIRVHITVKRIENLDFDTADVKPVSCPHVSLQLRPVLREISGKLLFRIFLALVSGVKICIDMPRHGFKKVLCDPHCISYVVGVRVCEHEIVKVLQAGS